MTKRGGRPQSSKVRTNDKWDTRKRRKNIVCAKIMAGRGDDSPPSCGDTAVLISNGGPSKGDGTEQEERCDNDRSAGRGNGYHKEAEAKRRR